METIYDISIIFCYRVGFHVSTLPIRNGNTTSLFFFIRTPCKYLTYKEWKQIIFLILDPFWVKVSTLPIRNGNLRDRTVSTLPIRNGNSVSLHLQMLQYSKYLTYKEWKHGQMSLSSQMVREAPSS